jgi:hypothetical protein
MGDNDDYCDELTRLHEMFMSDDASPTVTLAALLFLKQHGLCPRTAATLDMLLRAPSPKTLQLARNAWSAFYRSHVLPNGRCGSRFVINTVNNRTMCMPTTTPALVTQRSFSTIDECELALSMLPRGNIALEDVVYCNEYGCFQTPQWSNVPQYGFIPVRQDCVTPCQVNNNNAFYI